MQLWSKTALAYCAHWYMMYMCVYEREGGGINDREGGGLREREENGREGGGTREKEER